MLLPEAPGSFGTGCNGISLNVIGRRALRLDHNMTPTCCDDTSYALKTAAPEALLRVVFVHLGGHRDSGRRSILLEFGFRWRKRTPFVVFLQYQDRINDYTHYSHWPRPPEKENPFRATFLVSQPLILPLICSPLLPHSGGHSSRNTSRRWDKISGSNAVPVLSIVEINLPALERQPHPNADRREAMNGC